MFLHESDQHSKNDNLTESNRQIQYNPINIPSQFFTDFKKGYSTLNGKKTPGQQKESCTMKEYLEATPFLTLNFNLEQQ